MLKCVFVCVLVCKGFQCFPKDGSPCLQLSRTLRIMQKELLQVGIGRRGHYAGSMIEEEEKERRKDVRHC